MNLQKLIIVFHLLRPTFYAFSPTFARTSDFISLLLISGGAVFRRNNSLILISISIILFLLIVIISLMGAAAEGVIEYRDFIPLAYPIFCFFALWFGASFIEPRDFYSFVAKICFVGVLLGIAQEHGSNFGILLSEIYNTSALTVVGRFGGFSYTHTEHAAFCALFLVLYKTLKPHFQIRALFFLILAVYSLMIPLSKAGLILLLVVLIPFLTLRMSVFLFAMFFVMISFLYDYFIREYSYIFSGFQALFAMNLENGSIGPRFNDWFVTFDSLKEHLFFGGGPRRQLAESYIEITSANILYRFGVLGWIFYYLPIVYGIFLSYRKGCWFIMYFFLGIFIVDHAANFSESVKLFPVIYMLLGVLTIERGRLNEKEY